MPKWRVVLEVESDTHPDDWFWTDSCPSPSDEIMVSSVEQIESEDAAS